MCASYSNGTVIGRHQFDRLNLFEKRNGSLQTNQENSMFDSISLKNLRLVALASISATGLSMASQVEAQAFVPLLDEYEGIAENDGRYLILPAFENTDPNTRRRAYFIFPKFLQYAGDEDQDTVNLGVNHIGFSLLPDGSPDYAPRIGIVATVVAQSDSVTETAIKEALIERDLAEGFLEPSFPTPSFESYEIDLITAGLSDYDEDETSGEYPGGYPGQPFLIDFNLYTDVNRAFVLDTPGSSGRDANLWGVAIRGKIKGYGNRLDCSLTMNHKKVYDYFAARASGQAYWGLVSTDVSTEVRSMDDQQIIDFGACRGDDEKIEKLVMPAWQMILNLRNDDGDKMFYQMVKDVTTGTNHPGAASSGWGFQASARWAEVSSTKTVTFNFNVATQIEWTLPMAMSFGSSCRAFRENFINASNPNKACVDASDAQKIRVAQRACFKRFAIEIAALGIPDEMKLLLFKELRRDGCGFNFISPALMMSAREVANFNAKLSEIRTSLFTDVAALVAEVDAQGN